MKVHNFYSDILLSLSYFINNITSNSINTFQYNIGNRTFNLNYNPNYELPSAYITYTNTNHVNARPDSFLRSFSNTNQIPVLYDIEKQLGLKVQEDMFLVNIDVNLNTDSQLHIINLKHDIETRIPINKFLQFYTFTSYYELSEDYLNPYLFDVSTDTIENIYFKHDRVLDQLKYCFSMSYEPLVRLSSINFNDLETIAGSYGLNLNFELMIQMPVRLLFNYSLPSQEFAKYDDVKKLSYDNVKIPILSSGQEIEFGFIDAIILNNDTKYFLNLKYYRDKDKLFGHYNSNDLIFDYEGKIYQEQVTGIVTGLINNKYIDKGNVILTVGNANVIYGNIYSDVLNGSLKDVIIEDDILSGYFSGSFENSITSFKIENLNFNQTSKTYTVKNFTTPTKNITILNYRTISPNSIYSKIKTISVSRTEVNLELTKVKSLIFYNNNTTEYEELILSNSPNINEYGHFRVFENNIIIEGLINKQSGLLDVTTVNLLDDDLDLTLYEIMFDFVFDFYAKRGPGPIENLTIDFNIVNEFISDISPLSIPEIKDGNYTLVIDELEINKTDNNRYEFKIKLPYYNKKIVDNFIFFISYSKVKTDETQLDIILDTLKSTNEYLFFSTTESFYYNQLYKISKLYPLFFSTKLKK